MPGNWFLAESFISLFQQIPQGSSLIRTLRNSTASVAEEADVAGGRVQSRVVGQDFRFFDDVEIRIEDDHAVERHFDAAAVGGDFLFVPLADRFAKAGAGGNHVVDRAVILFGLILPL